MTPMIDMTFLLLIFFMVTSKITKEQKKLDIKLPVAVAKVPDEPKGREIINLDGEGKIYAGDNALSDYKELKAYLTKRLKDHPPLKVYIRADATTKAKEIRKVMNICSEAGAVEVIFGTHVKKS